MVYLRRSTLMKAPILLAFLGLAAAEPTGTLTLACQGTATQDAEPDAKEPISMGIVLNFTTRTVQGFPHIGGAEITKIDDGHIVFVARYHGSKEVHDEWGFVGTIDRVTPPIHRSCSTSKAYIRQARCGFVLPRAFTNSTRLASLP